jgi:hypothetical protein
MVWDVRRLVSLSKDLPVQQVDPAQFAELNENHWYAHGDQLPTPVSLLEHMALIEACDLSYPIILDANGRVMDGMHRICRAVKDGVASIPAVQFTTDPEPDYVDVSPEDLPYD